MFFALVLSCCFFSVFIWHCHFHPSYCDMAHGYLCRDNNNTWPPECIMITYSNSWKCASYCTWLLIITSLMGQPEGCFVFSRCFETLLHSALIATCAVLLLLLMQPAMCYLANWQNMQQWWRGVCTTAQLNAQVSALVSDLLIWPASLKSFTAFFKYFFILF